MSIRGAKTIAKRLLHAGTSLVHPWRRKRAHAVLRAGAPFDSVLFVCRGNICRSPYAEFAARRSIPESLRSSLTVDSAGFIGPGRKADETAVRVARERLLDLDPHISKVLTPELGDRGGLIVVMEAGQREEALDVVPAHRAVIVLGDLDPVRAGRRTIPDPWGKDIEVFRSSFDRIDRCLAEVMPYVGVGSRRVLTPTSRR